MSHDCFVEFCFRNPGVLCGNTTSGTRSQHLHTLMRIFIWNHIKCLHQTGINYKNKHIWMYLKISWRYVDTSSLCFNVSFQVGVCMLKLRKSSCPSCESQSQQRFTWIKSRRNREVGVAGWHFLFTSDDRWPDFCWLSWRLCALPLSWELRDNNCLKKLI